MRIEKKKSIETTTNEIVRTVQLPLQTSNRKRERVEEVIDHWQEIASFMGDMLISFDSDQWQPQVTAQSRMVRRNFPEKFENNDIRAHDAYQAAYKVAEAYSSWDANGREGERPQFGDGNYARLDHSAVLSLERHDDAKGTADYGIKLALQPYNPEWFGIRTRQYHRDYLDKVISGSADAGTVELAIDENGRVTCHLSVTLEVETIVADNLDRYLGVGLGINSLYGAAVVDYEGYDDTNITTTSLRPETSGKGITVGERGSTPPILGAQVESGDEMQHRREEFTQQYAQLMEKGDLRSIQNVTTTRERYTEHVCYRVGNEIADLASEHMPLAIVLEDLTNLRERVDEEAVHEWPYHLIQKKITEVATKRGIPVIEVDPVEARRSCPACNGELTQTDIYPQFECPVCGWGDNPYISKAINVATRAWDE